MPQMRRPNQLGALLRKHRQAKGVGFKQLAAATGLEPETLRKWEVGEIYEIPLRGAVLYAREVGITLDELAEAALSATSNDPGERPAATRDLADELSARDEELGSRGQRRRRRPPP